MDTERIWELLSNGGLRRSEARVAAEKQAVLMELRIPKYNGLADPAGAEELGRMLAGRARSLGPTAVLLWEDPLDVVLGHIVARELEVKRLRSYNAEGLIELIGALAPSSRVLLVTDAFREASLLLAMSNLVERHGSTVVGTAVLVETGALASAGPVAGTVVSLVDVGRNGPATGAAANGNGIR